MTTDPLASPPDTAAKTGRREAIGLVALAIGLTQFAKSMAYALPNSLWQQAFLSFVFTVVEIGLPCLLMWRWPASAAFDGRLMAAGFRPWLWAFLLTVVVLVVPRACRPLLTTLDGLFRTSMSQPFGEDIISPATIAADTIRLIIVAPIAEELFFRAFILGQLQKITSPSRAILIQATLFSACHAGPAIRPERLFGAFVMGITFGGWRIRFYGLLPLIVMHGAINAMAYLPRATREYNVANLPECRQIQAITHNPAEKAIPLIVQFLGNPDIRVRAYATIVLARRYRGSAGPYLREALSSTDDETVQSVIRLAHENAFQDLVPELRRLAWDHESRDVQMRALLQMMKLGETNEITCIASNHPDPIVRRAASRLLADQAPLLIPP